MGQSFVESVIPLRAIKTAVELQHSHDNKPLLDSLVSSGSSLQYLGADGQYHNFPEMFSTSAFLGKYNQVAGNVTAFEDEDGKVYLKATNTFASALDGRVIGSIELERASDKQLNVSIAEVDVNSGAITENEFKYITSGNGVKLGYTDGIVSVELVSSEAPFTTLMGKQLTAVVGRVGVFNASGQIIDGGVSLSDLVTSTVFAEHVSNTDLHVSEELQAAWNAKQVALTADQLVAVNSGITAVKVSQYDEYATGKLSVGGHTPTMNLVTDASGNVITEAKFDPSTKINTVPTAVLNRVAIFTETGNVKDSGIVLGAFPSTGTVKDYVDTLVSSSVSGASYQGTFTYFGTQIQIESVEATEGDTAIAYLGSLTDLEGLLRGNYDGLTWTFEDVQPAPVGGAWFETDNLLTNVPVVAGRIIVKMDGVNPPALDVRPQTTMQLDNVTIGLNFAGAVSFVMKSLSSGKSVLNTITADGVAYDFTNDGGTDTSKTIREVIEQNKLDAEPAFSKNTAFNKNFDTSNQSATSTQVIGNNDTRLSDSRSASDVYAWAKAENKPSYTFSEIGSKPTDISGYGITDAYTKTEIDAMLPTDIVKYSAQSLTDPQKAQARTNIGAGTSNFSGSYDDLSNKPTIPTVPSIATQAEAEAGADNAKMMTALRVKQAIDIRLSAGTLTLATGDWSGNTATKTITGLTNSDILKIAPVSKTDATNWATANIWVTHSGNTVTFAADAAPTASIAVVYEITKGVLS